MIKLITNKTQFNRKFIPTGPAILIVVLSAQDNRDWYCAGKKIRALNRCRLKHNAFHLAQAQSVDVFKIIDRKGKEVFVFNLRPKSELK